MTTMLDALDWLNKENNSLLSPGSLQKIARFWNGGLDAIGRMDLAKSLLNDANGMGNLFERAEMHSVCAAIFYQMMALQEARLWLKQAQAFYESAEDTHRQAVTGWMLYIVLRAQGNYRSGFMQGKLARDRFLEKERQYAILNYAPLRDWYKNTALRISREMIRTPEVMYEWLFEFRGSRLSDVAVQVRERLRQAIEIQDFDGADREAEALVEITRGARLSEEYGEALACRGSAEWTMERRMNAIYSFREALAQFMPNTHAYAMLTWMLGLAQYTFPTLRTAGITTLQRAIDLTDRLRIKAVRDNAVEECEWYALHLEAMKLDLDQWIVTQP